jgi:hypothetical protein
MDAPPNSWLDWINRFKPIKCPGSTKCDGLAFESDHPSIAKSGAKHVWSLIDVDGQLVVTNGLARIGKIGCFITEIGYAGKRCDFFCNCPGEAAILAKPGQDGN